jgi:hypothetical protein
MKEKWYFIKPYHIAQANEVECYWCGKPVEEIDYNEVWLVTLSRKMCLCPNCIKTLLLESIGKEDEK